MTRTQDQFSNFAILLLALLPVLPFVAAGF